MRRYTREDYEAYRKRIGREGGQEVEEHELSGPELRHPQTPAGERACGG
jgi:hypothetical protein